MSTELRDPPRPGLMTLPNQLTLARLGLSVVLFVFLAWGWFRLSLLLFAVAASTDWLDGYFARKYGLVTVLGRILDPFADKIIVCGTFILLSSVPASGIPAWISVVVVGRELLVTALRSFLESRGADFSASMSGKVKMLVQCLALLASLAYLGWPDGSPAISRFGESAVTCIAWAAMLATVYSGAAYVTSAARLLRAG